MSYDRDDMRQAYNEGVAWGKAHAHRWRKADPDDPSTWPEDELCLVHGTRVELDQPRVVLARPRRLRNGTLLVASDWWPWPRHVEPWTIHWLPWSEIGDPT